MHWLLMARLCKLALNIRTLFLLIITIAISLQISFIIFANYYLAVNDLKEGFIVLDELARACRFPLFLIDTRQLRNVNDDYSLKFDEGEISSPAISLAVDSSLLNGSARIYREIIPSLVSKGFLVETLDDTTSEPCYPGWPTVILMKRRSVTFYIRIFHVYEDNGWWFGSWRKDDNFLKKLKLFRIDVASTFTDEGHLSKFRWQELKLNGRISQSIWVPKYPEEFIREFSDSKFMECRVPNRLRSVPSTNYNEAARFTHRVKKLLSVVKAALDGIHVAFWISSGTCLGYLRHCNVIPHAKDVDIGVFAKDYTDQIVSTLEKHDVKLRLWFGEINDSLELSFVNSNGLKLDIFFFYHDGNTMWNGGTQFRTGKKFKYVFPEFDLCWTLFLGLKLRVPCDTEKYIIANYGVSWQVPVEYWDWKTSPYNVQENGEWPLDRRKYVVREFNQFQSAEESLKLVNNRLI